MLADLAAAALEEAAGRAVADGPPGELQEPGRLVDGQERWVEAGPRRVGESGPSEEINVTPMLALDDEPSRHRVPLCVGEIAGYDDSRVAGLAWSHRSKAARTSGGQTM